MASILFPFSSIQQPLRFRQDSNQNTLTRPPQDNKTLGLFRQQKTNKQTNQNRQNALLHHLHRCRLGHGCPGCLHHLGIKGRRHHSRQDIGDPNFHRACQEGRWCPRRSRRRSGSCWCCHAPGLNASTHSLLVSSGCIHLGTDLLRKKHNWNTNRVVGFLDNPDDLFHPSRGWD